jgi:hypothetical protein
MLEEISHHIMEETNGAFAAEPSDDESIEEERIYHVLAAAIGIISSN